MFNISRLQMVDSEGKTFTVSIDSASNYVTAKENMKHNNPHPFFVNGYLCNVMTYRSGQEMLMLSVKIDKENFLKETFLTVAIHEGFLEEIMIQVLKPEVFKRFTIVDVLYELNSYFNALGGLTPSKS